MVSATIVIATSCLLYLRTNNLITIVLIVGTIGIFNGLFNLAQSSVIQDISDAKIRLNTIIWMRLTSQIGLMVGASIAGSGVFYNFSQHFVSPKQENTTAISKNASIQLPPLLNDLTPYKTIKKIQK